MGRHEVACGPGEPARMFTVLTPGRHADYKRGIWKAPSKG